MIKDMKDQEFTKDEVVLFEKNHLQVFQNLANLTSQKKTLEDQEKQVKEQLEKLMDEYDIKSIDNEFLKITRVAASSSISIDLKELEKKEPDLHKELLEDYPKVTNKKAYLTFKVK